VLALAGELLEIAGALEDALGERCQWAVRGVAQLVEQRHEHAQLFSRPARELVTTGEAAHGLEHRRRVGARALDGALVGALAHSARRAVVDALERNFVGGLAMTRR